MGKFVGRVAFIVAAELVAYVISDAIITKIEDKKKSVVVDTILYTIS